MTDEEKIALVEKEIEAIEMSYAEACVELTKEKGFDEYLPKWQKKIDKLAHKYALLLVPLKEEHDELRILINEKKEEESNEELINTVKTLRKIR